MIQPLYVKQYLDTKELMNPTPHEVFQKVNEIITFLNSVGKHEHDPWFAGADIYCRTCGKVLVEKKVEAWRPQFLENYFFVNYLGQARETYGKDTKEDDYILNFGNYFRTKEEAESAAELVKQLLLSLKK